MRYRRLSTLVIVISLFSLFIIACGGDEGAATSEGRVTTGEDAGAAGSIAGDGTTDDVPAPEDAAWAGVWDIVTENGLPPSANGYNSIVLTLAADTFTSVYDSDEAGTCTWSGAQTAPPTTLTMTTDAATGPPCDQALGKTRTARLTLSADGNTLTLDWTAETMGTLQVYQRVSQGDSSRIKIWVNPDKDVF